MSLLTIFKARKLATVRAYKIFETAVCDACHNLSTAEISGRDKYYLRKKYLPHMDTPYYIENLLKDLMAKKRKTFKGTDAEFEELMAKKTEGLLVEVAKGMAVEISRYCLSSTNDNAKQQRKILRNISSRYKTGLALFGGFIELNSHQHFRLSLFHLVLVIMQDPTDRFALYDFCNHFSASLEIRANSLSIFASAFK